MTGNLNKEADFFTELRALLEKYDVDITAADDGQEYGQQIPLIQIQFNDPFAVYEFHDITASDDPSEDLEFRISK